MKTLWSAITIVMWINALALIGLIGWLGATGRLNRERLHQTATLFSMTVAAQDLQAKEIQLQAEQVAARSNEAMRLERIATGPATLQERVAQDALNNEVASQRLERLEREKADLIRQFDTAMKWFQQEEAKFTQNRKAFEEAQQREAKLRDDQDFRQAVAMYEQVPARQAKDMFMELLRKNKTDQVVDYLAAMTLRKSAAVIKEFKTPQEVPVAADLIQRLRTRGVDMLTRPGNSRGNNPSVGAAAPNAGAGNSAG